MNYTTNLNLKLPAYTDPVDIADINDNFNTIDNLNLPQNKIIMTDVTVRTWITSSDTTMIDSLPEWRENYDKGYIYVAQIQNIAGITDNHTGSIIFDSVSALSGDLSPVFGISDSGVFLFSKKDKGNTVTVKRMELWT